MLTRRNAILLSVAGVLCPLTASTAGKAGFGRQRYENALVVDALGGPGGFDPNSPDNAPLSPTFIADVQASGVTAVNVTVNEPGNGPNRFDKAVAGIAAMEHEITVHPDVFIKVLRAKDLTEAKATHRMGLIFGFQDGSMIEGDLARLATFYDLGVRISQPTYNRRNLLGDGCLEPSDGGLSRLGHEFIAEMNRLGMLLDLSHAGPRTISEGIAASAAPMAITHTGCRALVDVPRNTSDSLLKSLADRGGVVGIYFMPFLRASGQPHAEDLIRHLEHAVGVCGEDHVGLGTDGGISGIALTEDYAKFQRKFFEDRAKAGLAASGEAADVFNLIPEYNEPRRFETLADDLARRGWTATRIEKILGRNFARLFGDVWKP
jgi:membrane dipeptidase